MNRHARRKAAASARGSNQALTSAIAGLNSMKNATQAAGEIRQLVEQVTQAAQALEGVKGLLQEVSEDNAFLRERLSQQRETFLRVLAHATDKPLAEVLLLEQLLGSTQGPTDANQIDRSATEQRETDPGA